MLLLTQLWIFLTIRLPVTVLTIVTPSHFEILNFNVFKKMEIFLNMGPHRRENFKRLLLVSYNSFQPNAFGNVPCDSPHKVILKFQSCFKTRFP